MKTTQLGMEPYAQVDGYNTYRDGGSIGLCGTFRYQGVEYKGEQLSETVIWIDVKYHDRGTQKWYFGNPNNKEKVEITDRLFQELVFKSFEEHVSYEINVVDRLRVVLFGLKVPKVTVVGFSVLLDGGTILVLGDVDDKTYAANQMEPLLTVDHSIGGDHCWYWGWKKANRPLKYKEVAEQVIASAIVQKSNCLSSLLKGKLRDTTI